jgi:branched-chain amino acid transport system ATP-binding protein
VSAPALEVTGLRAGYGDIPVIHGLDLAVPPGQVAVIIGPNGHGKTTLLRTVSGLLRPAAGQIVLGGEAVTGRPAEHLAKLGLVHVPQGDGLFPEMTVEENLLMGAFPADGWRARRQALPRVYELFPELGERRRQRARTLSGGERRMLALGRGLMRRSRIMLIDEPSLGLAPAVIGTVYQAIGELKASGATIVLAEENFSHIGAVADVVHVVEQGTIVASGSYRELSQDPLIVETYLGSV